jgi:hypothetical protein
MPLKITKSFLFLFKKHSLWTWFKLAELLFCFNVIVVVLAMGVYWFKYKQNSNSRKLVTTTRRLSFIPQADTQTSHRSSGAAPAGEAPLSARSAPMSSASSTPNGLSKPLRSRGVPQVRNFF